MRPRRPPRGAAVLPVWVAAAVLSASLSIKLGCQPLNSFVSGCRDHPSGQRRPGQPSRGQTGPGAGRWATCSSRPQQKRAGGAAAPRQRREAQLGPATEEAWPLKASRARRPHVDWGKAKPLPLLLFGAVERALRGVVEGVTPEGAVVRLLWEVAADGAAESAGQPSTRPSPLRGFLDAEAVRAALGPLGDQSHGGVTLLREKQPVSVRVSSRGGPAEDALPLELTREQPLEPRRRPRPFAAQRPLASLERFLRNHSIRVGGLDPTGLEAATAPPEGWDDEDWAGWLHEAPRGGPAPPRLVAAAWALADHGRDLVAVGPLAPAERALLYALPLLRHLREHPHPATGSGPIAVVLGDASLSAALKEALAPHGIDVADTFSGDNHAQRAQLAGCWVAAPNPGYFRSKASERWAQDFAQVSFLAVDDLGLWAREEPQALRHFLGHLPPHDWGPSLVWMPRWDARAEPLLGAFVERPLTLRAGEGVFGARVAHEALPRSELALRVAAHMHRHPERRVLIFADDVQALYAQLARVDTQGRLSRAGRATTVLAPNLGGWSPGGQAFDVVVHADAPPSLDEYRRRLASCRAHAFALVTVILDGRSRQLDPRWLPFVPPHEWTRLRRMKVEIEERDIVEHIYLSEKKEGGPAGLEGDEEGASFQDDFSLGKNGELVWDAGEESVDEEFAVFSEAL